MEEKKTKLGEKINNLPTAKSMKFIELFSKAQDKANWQSKIKYTRVRYNEKDYVDLLNRSLSDKKLEKELDKMVPATSLRVFKIVANEAKELAKLGNIEDTDTEDGGFEDTSVPYKVRTRGQ